MAVAAAVVAAMVDTVAGAAVAAVAAIGVSAFENRLVELALTFGRRCQCHAHGPLTLVNRWVYMTDFLDGGLVAHYGRCLASSVLFRFPHGGI